MFSFVFKNYDNCSHARVHYHVIVIHHVMLTVVMIHDMMKGT